MNNVETNDSGLCNINTTGCTKTHNYTVYMQQEVETFCLGGILLQCCCSLQFENLKLEHFVNFSHLLSDGLTCQNRAQV